MAIDLNHLGLAIRSHPHTSSRASDVTCSKSQQNPTTAPYSMHPCMAWLTDHAMMCPCCLFNICNFINFHADRKHSEQSVDLLGRVTCRRVDILRHWEYTNDKNGLTSICKEFTSYILRQGCFSVATLLFLIVYSIVEIHKPFMSECNPIFWTLCEN